MPYPFSITKRKVIRVAHFQNKPKSMINLFQKELEKDNCIVKRLNDGKLEIAECVIFSSNSRLKNYNKGKVWIESEDGQIIISMKIILFEHLVFFCLLFLLGITSIYNFDGEYELISVFLILTFTNFVFFYLIPWMNINSFFERTINKISEL